MRVLTFACAVHVAQVVSFVAAAYAAVRVPGESVLLYCSVACYMSVALAGCVVRAPHVGAVVRVGHVVAVPAGCAAAMTAACVL